MPWAQLSFCLTDWVPLERTAIRDYGLACGEFIRECTQEQLLRGREKRQREQFDCDLVTGGFGGPREQF